MATLKELREGKNEIVFNRNFYWVPFGTVGVIVGELDGDLGNEVIIDLQGNLDGESVRIPECQLWDVIEIV